VFACWLILGTNNFVAYAQNACLQLHKVVKVSSESVCVLVSMADSLPFSSVVVGMIPGTYTMQIMNQHYILFESRGSKMKQLLRPLLILIDQESDDLHKTALKRPFCRVIRCRFL
jgi:hypothetical protein